MTVAIAPEVNTAQLDALLALPDAHDAQLGAVLAFLDTGTDPARLRVYAGARPATVDDAPAGGLLAEIALTKPAGTVAGGALTLTQAEDGLIAATGVATWARLVNGAGDTALDLDCSDGTGAGDLTLATTQLYLGGAARIVSAVLA